MVILMLFKYFSYGRMKEDIPPKEVSVNIQLKGWYNYGYCKNIFYFKHFPSKKLRLHVHSLSDVSSMKSRIPEVF